MKIALWIVVFLAGYFEATARADAPVPVPGEPQAAACRKAYRMQDLGFLLEHCPEEAWALARARCEREPAKVEPAFVEFCGRFYTGTAPTYGK